KASHLSMEVMMKKMSWILSAFALAALIRPGTSTAQEPKATPAAPPAAAMTTAPTVLTAGCCGTACCDAGYCNSCCDRRGGIIADVAFQVLQPHWQNNPAFFVDEDIELQKDFGFNMQFVPKFTLGYVGEGGLGIRTSWWGFAVGAKRSAQTGAAA